MKDGGTAFPVLYRFEKLYDCGKEYQKAHYDHLGMTLRDYFAGQALAGLLATSIDWSEKYGTEKIYSTIAKMSYSLADALLAERGKQSE
jgi:hypothetical protein